VDATTGYWWERKKGNDVAVPWGMAGSMNDFTKHLNSNQNKEWSKHLLGSRSYNLKLAACDLNQ
jgi:hypothetical protein